MALLERLERRKEHSGLASVTEVVEEVRESMLEQYPHAVLTARDDAAQRERLREMVEQLLVSQGVKVARLNRQTLSSCVVQELVGYGPIDSLLDDHTVTEIMVNGPYEVFVEREGEIRRTSIEFNDDEQLVDLILRMVSPLGRRIDRSNPYVDARLPDGSRVNAVLPPLSTQGPILTIRRFPQRLSDLSQMVDTGTLSEEMAVFMRKAIGAKLNIVISGGTSSGKTTTLGILCQLVEPRERIICIEDSSELSIPQRHIVNLETRQPNLEGQGEVTIRQLVRNALRMRPDRLVIGEVRGEEAFDLVQAMNTGHAGSMTTVHANSAPDALKRLEGMVLTAGQRLPVDIIRQHLGAAIDIIIHQMKAQGGQRRITDLSAVRWSEEAQQCRLTCLYRDAREGWQDTADFVQADPIPDWIGRRLSHVEASFDKEEKTCI